MIRWLAKVFVLGSCAFQAQAQTYPAKPMRVIVASPPGTSSDLVLRRASQELSPRLNQTLIIDNRAGATEILAQEACAKAPADGYTLCIVSKDGMSYNPHLISKLPYDPEKDYRPVTRLYFLIESLAVSATLPVNSIKELQDFAVSKPGALNFGTRGAGGNLDFFRLWLGDRWKTDIVAVPYKGVNFVFNGLVSGELQLGNVALGMAIGQAKSGKIKILAIALSKRSPLMPQVPTFDEVGLGGAPTRPFWGLVVPAGTPEEIVRRLNAEFVWLFREPKFLQFMDSRHLESAVGTPEEFGAFLRADREQIGQLVARYNIPRQ
jgi:tripartite-type tricarboxylate transporter receptor subunit TctC